MKNNYIFLITLSVLVNCSLAQDYTWEKYHTPTTGGQQSNGSYSAFTSTSWHQTGSMTDIDHEAKTGFLLPRIDTRPPVITNITDVPNDQGRRVNITWDRSGYDDEYDQDNFYSVWRQDDEPTAQYKESQSSIDLYEILELANKYPEEDWFWIIAGEVWTYVGDIPALVYDQYAFNAQTLHDFFPPDILNLSTFKVVFHAVSDYYESLPYSGYSIDNLAPAEPLLAGEFKVTHTQLQWDESPAEDFQYFAVYKSSEPGLPLIEPMATTLDPQFADYDTESDQVYYTVTAFDFNGNESGPSNLLEIDTRLQLDLTVFLEGPFSGTEMLANLNNQGFIPTEQPFQTSPWNYGGTESVTVIPGSNIVDWVLLDLRDAPDASSATASTTVALQAAFLLANGQIVDMDGISKPGVSATITQNLFVAVWHRNHLGILSSITPPLLDGLLTYDFSTDASQVYGGTAGYKELSAGTWGMVAGDGNADGSINGGDKIINWSVEAGTAGYLQGDFNMDGQVSNPDKNETWLLNLGKVSQVPD